MNVLIIDKDVAEARRIRKLLDWEKLGFSSVFTAYSEESFEEMAEKQTFDVVICGESFLQKNGLKKIRQFRENHARAEIIF